MQTSQELRPVIAEEPIVVTRPVSVISPTEHLIDCDANPECPAGFKIHAHMGKGKVRWTRSKSNLRLVKGKGPGRHITIGGLLFELGDQPYAPANLLDHFLKYPEIVPEDLWDGAHINECLLFPGTRFAKNGSLFIRYLTRIGKDLASGFHYVNDSTRLRDSHSAVILRIQPQS